MSQESGEGAATPAEDAVADPGPPPDGPTRALSYRERTEAPAPGYALFVSGCFSVLVIAVAVVVLVWVGLVAGFQTSVKWFGLLAAVAAVVFLFGAIRAAVLTSREKRRRGQLTPEQRAWEEESERVGRAVHKANWEASQPKAGTITPQPDPPSRFDRLEGGLRPDGGAELLAAFRQMLGLAGIGLPVPMEMIDRAGRAMYQSEKLIMVATADVTGFGRVQGLVITSARLLVIRKDQVLATNLADIKRIQWLPMTVETTCRLDVWFNDGLHLHWRDIQPKAHRSDLVAILRPGGPSLRDRTPLSTPSRVPVTTCRAQYLGGEMKWLDGPGGVLKPGSMVEVDLTQDDFLRIKRKGALLAEFPAADPGVVIDSEDNVKRAVKGGPLAATAVATLILGPIGLIGLLASTERRVKTALVLVVSTGDSYGVFALSDPRVGLRMKARTLQSVTPELAASDQAEKVIPTPGPAADSGGGGTAGKLDALERLASLHAQGSVSEVEYEQLKAEVLRGDSPAESKQLDN